MRAENEALHDYVLGLAPAPEPRICLLPTASGDPQEQISVLPRGDGPAQLRRHLDLALPARRDRDRPRRPPARAGHRLRDRRQHGQPDGALARARPRRDPARGAPARDRALRLQRRLDVLVRVGRLARRRQAGRDARARAARGQPLRPLLAGPAAAQRLPGAARQPARCRPGSRSTTTRRRCSATARWSRRSRSRGSAGAFRVEAGAGGVVETALQTRPDRVRARRPRASPRSRRCGRSGRCAAAAAAARCAAAERAAARPTRGERRQSRNSRRARSAAALRLLLGLLPGSRASSCSRRLRASASASWAARADSRSSSARIWRSISAERCSASAAARSSASSRSRRCSVARRCFSASSASRSAR